MEKNHHDTQIPADKLQQAKAKIQEGIELLKPYCQRLYGDEKERMLCLGPKMKPFVDMAFELATQNPTLAGTNVNMDEFAIDKDDYTALDVLVPILMEALNMTADTQVVAGSEALHSALTIYSNAQYLAKSGTPGAKEAYDALRARYPAGRRRAAAAAATTA